MWHILTLQEIYRFTSLRFHGSLKEGFRLELHYRYGYLAIYWDPISGYCHQVHADGYIDVPQFRVLGFIP